MRYCQVCHRCFGDRVEFCLFDHTPTRAIRSLPLVIDGKYRLEQLIAHGGMGSVYRATHLQLERAVAIKILRAEYLADPAVSERFNREARAAARLKHPNIVAVYDFGILPNGGAYLVMELIVGRSLREEMRTQASRYGQMRPERAAAILSQICAGIEAAHRQGIVHRDLKPDNVMIETCDDGTERVLVLDFGIAKLKDREHALQSITDENTVIGTPNYISPEQCTGQAVDARTDVYSLGVILYEMLTGRVPFASQNTSTVLLRHLQEPPAPPSRFRTGLSEEMEEVVLRALAKNPNHRFQSASQFAEDLVSAVRAYPRIINDEDETLARRPVVAAPQDAAPVPDLTLIGIAPRPAVFESPPPEMVPPKQVIVERVPQLLIEQTPRHKLYATLACIILLVIGTLGYTYRKEWSVQADPGKRPEASSPDPARGNPETGIRADSRAARLKGEGVQGSSQTLRNESTGTANSAPSGEYEKVKMEPPVKHSLPVVPVKDEMTVPPAGSAERAQRELRTIYSDWAMAAVRGDWEKHMSYYGDQVEYFRNGVLPRSKIEVRKRNIFSGLDYYLLRFSESPQVYLKNSGGLQEADVIFERQWILRRGRKRVEGQAQGVITLRRDSRGWSIVSERQIKK